MSDEQKTDSGESRDPNDAGEDTSQGTGGRMGDGIRQGIGVLSAFKDALEETIQEARDRGDLSTERAKEVMKETLERAQGAAEGAKDKLDFASQADMDSVRTAVDSLRGRLAELEESVFGASKEEAAEAASTPRQEGGAEDSDD